MRPYTLLRTISSKLPGRLSPPPVTPWPPVRTAFDQFLISELDNLRQSPARSLTSAEWMHKALDIAIVAQTMAGSVTEIDKKSVDGYYRDSTELLDACNCLRERLYVINNYVRNIECALHWLDVEGEFEPSQSVLIKARDCLDSCQEEERRLKKLNAVGLATRNSRPESLITFFVVGVLDLLMSFKARKGLMVVVQGCDQSLSWMDSLNEVSKQVKDEVEKRRKGGNIVLDELRELVSVVKALRGIVCMRINDKKVACREEMNKCVELLRRRCSEMEERMKGLEGRVDELYRQLMCIRMVLLERFP
ncbi:hypothetical protein J5N97_020821 [Dioscorea zingiberensis]|uniref:Uncharacterized protein n=1 Tax=Dioscorea zingiberensis TaxID=325984 RepID=A0A9D5CGI6_9LILI|nr:hypothetical protein J5N97_020821 [Dioscorea zingiberensis]